MGAKYRISLFLYQLWTLIFETALSFVATPVLFFPMTMGYINGLAQNVDGSLYPLTVFLFMNVAAIGVAILTILFSRYHAVLSTKHFLKLHSKGSFSLTFVY